MDLSNVAKLIKIPPAARALLERPEKEVSLAVSVYASDSKLIQTYAYLCFYSTARGPAKGGIRFHPEVTLAQVRKLAELMVWKTALVGIPFGGGKMGVAIDPHDLTRSEKAVLIRELVHLIRHDLMGGDYIPAPDMGTDARDMATIFGETHMLETVTGKPPRAGGLPGRQEATGRGVASVTEMLAKNIGLKPDKTTVAIQGFGNVGSWAAHFLHSHAFNIVAISDVTGACYNPNGLDIPTLETAYAANGSSLASCPVGDKIARDELLELPVDILVPAASSGVLTSRNAEQIKAKYIIEAANDPTSPEAEHILEQRGALIVPDILANAGGVIASYVEWRKARSGSLTPRSETYQVIDTVIGEAFEIVSQRAREHQISWRLAAQAKAVEEVVSTMADRGWI
jgi:glutamate dehydrogenase (NAD(P)+)